MPAKGLLEARQVTEIQGNRNSKWDFKDTEIAPPMEDRERVCMLHIYTVAYQRCYKC